MVRPTKLTLAMSEQLATFGKWRKFRFLYRSSSRCRRVNFELVHVEPFTDRRSLVSFDVLLHIQRTLVNGSAMLFSFRP